MRIEPQAVCVAEIAQGAASTSVGFVHVVSMAVISGMSPAAASRTMKGRSKTNVLAMPALSLPSSHLARDRHDHDVPDWFCSRRLRRRRPIVEDDACPFGFFRSVPSGRGSVDLVRESRLLPIRR